MNDRIKALIFDAYGTLFDVHSVAATTEELFPGHGAALSQMWRAKQIEYMFIRSLMGRYVPHDQNTESALVYVCRALGLDCDGQKRQRLMDAYVQMKPFPEAEEALNALSGYKRAILSVGTPRMLEEMVRNAGLSSFFDKLISVHKAQVYKPHPKVYQLAQDELGLEKSEIGFVTSNFFDVAGAKSFGFTVFWINRGNVYPDELGVMPDATVSQLTELPKLLEGRVAP
jgi:2-haloacid dehalogenase